MQLAVRSSVAAGVAVIGACALVAAPVAPPMPDLPDVRVPAVHSAAVELSALATPVTALSTLSEGAVDTSGGLGQRALESVAPSIPALLLPQLPSLVEIFDVANALLDDFLTGLAEAPARLQDALALIAEGQITSALNNLTGVVLLPLLGPAIEAIFSGQGSLVDLVDLLQRPFEFLPPVANVIGLLADPDFLLVVGLGPLQSNYLIQEVIGGTAEAFIAALQSGNPAAVVGSLVTGVADITHTLVDQLLNPGDEFGNNRGLIATVLEAGRMIIEALGAPAAVASVPAAINATTTETDTSVTLSTDPVSGAEAQPAADLDTTEPAAVTSDAAEEEVTEIATTAESAAVTSDATEEDVTKIETVDTKQTAVVKPDVRVGLVAVPGEVTVGVADDATPSDGATQLDSRSSSGGAGSTPDTVGTDDDPQASGATGASDGASGTAGDGPGDSE